VRFGTFFFLGKFVWGGWWYEGFCCGVCKVSFLGVFYGGVVFVWVVVGC